MTVVCVGGLDPLGRAGLIADRSACSAVGVHAVVVCTALTAQDDESCLVQVVDAGFLADQLQVVFRSSSKLVVKVGWLAGESQLKVLLELLPDDAELIVDPLMRTTSGVEVFSGDMSGELYQRYIERSDLFTPNLVEAKRWLTASSSDAAELASSLQLRGASRVLLKGGHSDSDCIDDFFIDHDGGLRIFRHDRYPGHHRGTGCRLASSVAARVSQGCEYEHAVAMSIEWLTQQIEAASNSETHT